MIWLLFAFLSALSRTMRDLFSKKGVNTIDEYLLSWFLRFFSAAMILPLLIYSGIPELGTNFLPALVVVAILNAITTVLYIKALKHSDLSLASPIVTFTPIFMLITSPLILGEFPSSLGLAGILLIVFGAYFLNIKQRHIGYLAPLKSLVKERGPRYMLLVAILWSINSNVDKIGINNSSVPMWAFSVSFVVSLILTPFILKRGIVSNIKSNSRLLVPLGIVSGLGVIFHVTAISMGLVIYVVSVKRTSVIMNILVGKKYFNEKGIRERLVGSIIMVLGVILIALG